MEENLEINQKALVSFLQALAVTIDALDTPIFSKVSSAEFLHVMDGVLSELGEMAELDDGEVIQEAVQVLRGNLDIALKQVRGAKRTFNVQG